MFIRYAAFHLQQLSAKRQCKNIEQKSIEGKDKDSDKKEAVKETEKATKRDNKSQEKEVKEKKKKEEKKDKQEKLDAKKDDVGVEDTENIDVNIKEKVDELLLSENYSDIDTDVAKKIVESITDSICSGGKQETDCKYIHNRL